MISDSPFKWHQFEGQIILLCVRWYLRYCLSYRDLEGMMAVRSLNLEHTTIPEATNGSWRADETYIKVKGKWMYLYPAVDSAGNALEFLLSENRDTQGAKWFLAGHLMRATPPLLG
jgi:IS6 family transposase